MNRDDLTRALRTGAGLSARQASRALELVFGTTPSEGLIAAALEREERVVISGFGSFFTRSCRARLVRDPRTGICRLIEPRRVPAFRPGARLRNRVE